MPLNYSIVGHEDTSYLNTPRMVYRVVLEIAEVPNTKDMEEAAIKIWEYGNKKWEELTVFMYLPKMNTKGGAYGIGKFTPKGLKEFKIMDISLCGTKWEDKCKE